MMHRVDLSATCAELVVWGLGRGAGDLKGRPVRIRQYDGGSPRVHPAGSEAKQALDLCRLIGGDEFENLVALGVVRAKRRSTPGDLGAPRRGLDRRLLAEVPHQRPTQRRAPEQADRPRAVAGEFAKEAAPAR